MKFGFIKILIKMAQIVQRKIIGFAVFTYIKKIISKVRIPNVCLGPGTNPSDRPEPENWSFSDFGTFLSFKFKKFRFNTKK